MKRLSLFSNEVRHLHYKVGTGLKGEPFQSLFYEILSLSPTGSCGKITLKDLEKV